MRNSISISVITLGAWIALALLGCVPKEDSPSTEGERTYVVGITPFLADDEKDEVYRRLAGMILEDLPLHSSLWIYDAYEVKTVAHLRIPNRKAFQSGKTRANQFKEEIAKIKAFLAAAREPQSDDGGGPSHAIRFPQFIDFLAETRLKTADALKVIVLGSPLYEDPKEPAFSMRDGYFPSDGHLLAESEATPFGLKHKQNRMKESQVHFAWFGDPWNSAVHRDKVARFWSLYLAEQGARMATFCRDLPTLFEAAFSNTGNEQDVASIYEIDPDNPKIEMLRIQRDVDAIDWITRDIDGGAVEPPSVEQGPMKIGIRWRGAIDLDLYARPQAEGEVLFFQHMRSPVGYYYKDHRSSPDREFEFIEFTRDVNLWNVEASVNFYEGSLPVNPSGEVRVEFENRIYTARFTLPANHGNQGRSGDSQRDYWIALDIPSILKLR